VSDTCIDCGDDTAWGSGKYVNRVPADDGYLCADCQLLECDLCEETIELDCDIKVYGNVYCEACLVKEWQGVAMTIQNVASDPGDMDMEERLCAMERAADKLVTLSRH